MHTLARFRFTEILLTAWVYAVCPVGMGWAQDMPPEDSSIAGALMLGRSTFALPPGQWKVVSNGYSKTGSTNRVGNQGADVAYVYLVQVDADNTFVASMLHRATLASTSAASWTDTTCDRKDTLHRDVFSENLRFPECLLINHIVRFWVAAPTSESDKKVWNWFQVNKVNLPSTVLTCSYRKYFAGDFVVVAVSVNPEKFGQPWSTRTVWSESEWHPNAVKSDQARAAFVDGFKKWCYVMAENAKATLSDRKPKLATLPSLTELKPN